MASEMLLINPRRRKARKAGAKRRRKNPSAAQRANWARFAKASRARSANPRRRRRTHRRATNPIGPMFVTYPRRRRNPARRAHHARRLTNPIRSYRRRRNPIIGGSLFNARGYMAPLKEAAIMGGGAIAVDIAFGYINRYLPTALQRKSGQVGLGDAVKLLITVAMGKALSKHTRGLSNKAAMGSLVVQMRDIAMSFLPSSITSLQGARLGFVNPGRVVPGLMLRSNANSAFTRGAPMAGARLGAYAGGSSPLLQSPMGAFMPGTQLLNGPGMRRPAHRR